MQIDLEAVAQFFGTMAEFRRANSVGAKYRPGAASALMFGVPLRSLFGAKCAPASA
jgi:hypothetical protein